MVFWEVFRWGVSGVEKKLLRVGGGLVDVEDGEIGWESGQRSQPCAQISHVGALSSGLPQLTQTSFAEITWAGNDLLRPC